MRGRNKMSTIHNPGWREHHYHTPTEAESEAANTAYAAGLIAPTDTNPHDSFFAAFEWRAWEEARACVRYDAWLRNGEG